MSIISLISDWYKNDYYSAVVKARILSQLPDAQILDIHNQIEKFDINQVAFVLSSALEHFPDHTIHIVAVQAHKREDTHFFIGQYGRQYIITADNDLPGLLQQQLDAIYLVKEPLSTFPEADQFAPTAVRLAQNTPLEQLGEKIELKNLDCKAYPTIEEDKITAQIRYIDSYGNAHININKETFESVRNGRAFSIYPRSVKHSIERIYNNYNEVPTNTSFAIFNTTHFLEIGVNMGSIAEQHNLKELEEIVIIFRNALF